MPKKQCDKRDKSSSICEKFAMKMCSKLSAKNKQSSHLTKRSDWYKDESHHKAYIKKEYENHIKNMRFIVAEKSVKNSPIDKQKQSVKTSLPPFP